MYKYIHHTDQKAEFGWAALPLNLLMITKKIITKKKGNILRRIRGNEHIILCWSTYSVTPLHPSLGWSRMLNMHEHERYIHRYAEIYCLLTPNNNSTHENRTIITNVASPRGGGNCNICLRQRISGHQQQIFQNSLEN